MTRQTALLVTIPLLIGLAGLAADQLDVFDKYRQFTQGSSVPRSLTQAGNTGKEFRLLDYGDASDFRLQGLDESWSYEDFPSSKNVAVSGSDKVLSIVVNEEDLWNPVSGIAANPFKTGRDFERPSSASIFNNGSLSFASVAGLRVHGGKSRRMQNPSWRLHFRPLYGQPSVSSGLFFDDGPELTLTSLIVHNDVRQYRPGVHWRFVNPIAYSIAETTGCMVPRTSVSRVLLNGEDNGIFVLTEHYSIDYFRNLLGHNEFVLVRSNEGMQGTKYGSPARYGDLIRWASTLRPSVSLDDIEARVDLKNLTNWIIAITFLGVTDAFQGPAIFDYSDSKTAAQWEWYTYDLDHAFWDVYGQAPQPWLVDIFVGKDNLESPRDPRAVIFTHLRQNSAEYRLYFLNRFTEVMNHILTKPYLQSLVRHYSDLAAAYELDNSAFEETIKVFLSERSAVLRQQVSKHFSAGPAYKFSLTADPGVDVLVNGHSVGHQYSGVYYSNTPVTVKAQTEQGELRWAINGSADPDISTFATFTLADDMRLVIESRYALNEE